MNEKIGQVMEIIGQELIDYGDVDTPNESTELVDEFLDIAKDAYVKMSLGNSQKYIKEDWFKNDVIIINDICFIPINRIFN